MADKGGVSAGRDAFRNVASHPTPNWNNEKQVSGRHLPDAATFARVRHFAAVILKKIDPGETISPRSEIAIREGLRGLTPVRLNPGAICKHTADAGKCLGCQTYVRKCPNRAIHATAGVKIFVGASGAVRSAVEAFQSGRLKKRV